MVNHLGRCPQAWSLPSSDRTCHLPLRLQSPCLVLPTAISPDWAGCAGFWKTWPLHVPLLRYLCHIFLSWYSPLDSCTRDAYGKEQVFLLTDLPVMPRTLLAIKAAWRDLTQSLGIMPGNTVIKHDYRKLQSTRIFFLFRLSNFHNSFKSPLVM